MAIAMIPRSIRGRLLLAAVVFTGVALLLAGLFIGSAFERLARRGLTDRLDGQLEMLAQTVRPDGTLDRTRLEQIGPMTLHRRGWGWKIAAPNGTIDSRDVVPPPWVRGLAHGHGPNGERRGFIGKEDEDHGVTRTLTLDRPAGRSTISAWAPRDAEERIHRTAVAPWVVSLGTLAAFLAAATFLQLRVGLRPLAQVKDALKAVRTGSSGRISEDQPLELKELVQELNGLLDENEAALDRARGHVANLAHSLKTPLATLDLKLREAGRDPDGALTALVAQVEGAIRHHLGRARAASPGAPGQLKVDLRPTVSALIGILGRIYAERGVEVDNGVPPGTSVKCDRQDLDEMLGNLLDNGWKWASGQIAVSAVEEGASVRILIDDDGPGLTADAIDKALVRGQRLDEREDGHGFGLPIARELAELHGGSLELGRGPLGGLRAILTLPR